MDNRDQGYPGGFGRNRYGQDDERRYGETAYAYNRGRDGGGNTYRTEPGRGGYDQGRHAQGSRDDIGREGDYSQRGYWRSEEVRDDEFGRGEAWLARGPHTGRGPRCYQRSDERIREEVCERLTRHGQIDASDIEVEVQGGEVTLRGEADDRRAKRLAEDTTESISGVRDVQNQLRIRQMQGRGTPGDDAFLGSGSRVGHEDRQGGIATSSAMVGTGTAAGIDSAYGSPLAGTQQGGGSGSADYGAAGIVNTGSGAGLSAGNATGGTAFDNDPDAAWQRERSGFQEHFTARHPAQGEATTRRTWDEAEPNYRYGYEAARSGRYRGRGFEEIEPDLRRDYEAQARTGSQSRESNWEQLREEVRAGFNRVRQG